jgi:hypothetical protein
MASANSQIFQLTGDINQLKELEKNILVLSKKLILIMLVI